MRIWNYDNNRGLDEVTRQDLDCLKLIAHSRVHVTSVIAIDAGTVVIFTPYTLTVELENEHVLLWARWSDMTVIVSNTQSGTENPGDVQNHTPNPEQSNGAETLLVSRNEHFSPITEQFPDTTEKKKAWSVPALTHSHSSSHYKFPLSCHLSLYITPFLLISHPPLEACVYSEHPEVVFISPKVAVFIPCTPDRCSVPENKQPRLLFWSEVEGRSAYAMSNRRLRDGYAAYALVITGYMSLLLAPTCCGGYVPNRGLEKKEIYAHQ